MAEVAGCQPLDQPSRLQPNRTGCQSADLQESLGDGGDESWDGFGGWRHGWVVVGPRRGRDGRGAASGGGAGGTVGRREGAHGGPQMAGHDGRQREAADVRLDRRRSGWREGDALRACLGNGGFKWMEED
jgi:hypothetical protein